MWEGAVDIATWLRELGLEHYEQAFRDNDVDVDLLPDLTEADLEKLGVASLGHRKILLRAKRPCVGVEPNWRPARPPLRTTLAPPPPASRSEADSHRARKPGREPRRHLGHVQGHENLTIAWGAKINATQLARSPPSSSSIKLHAVLCSLAFPAQHRAKLYSTNLLER
jgi:SAM domain (Sterile alpha motif)